MPCEKHLSQVGGVSAIIGVVLLVAGTLMQPLDADPADSAAAFAAYAADGSWVFSHLVQLFGAMLCGGGLLALTWKLREGPAGAWAMLAAFATVASVALAGALQAVEGVALDVMVERWVAAGADGRAAFEAAQAVRQIEGGLASSLGVLFGTGVLLYGIAMIISPVTPRWLGAVGVLTGLATVSSSVVRAYSGFSDVAIATSTPTTLAVLMWVICAAVFLLGHPGPPEEDEDLLE